MPEVGFCSVYWDVDEKERAWGVGIRYSRFMLTEVEEMGSIHRKGWDRWKL